MKYFRLGLAMTVLAICTLAQAAFPDKPIKIIVGFPPGGPLDTHARLLVDQLQKHLG